MADTSHRDSVLKIVYGGDELELWLEELSTAELNRLALLLRNWGFGPEYKVRAATEAELAGLEGLPGIAEMTRKRGLAIYESPLRIRRRGDGSDGRAFDALRDELSQVDGPISSQRLEQILQDVRLRNLRPGEHAHWYFF